MEERGVNWTAIIIVIVLVVLALCCCCAILGVYLYSQPDVLKGMGISLT